MDNRILQRVPEITSNRCPFCSNELRRRTAKCRNHQYNDGKVFERELYYCTTCDLWYAIKGKTNIFKYHNVFCFPLLEGKEYTIEMLQWRTYGKPLPSSLKGEEDRSPAVTRKEDAPQREVPSQQLPKASLSKPQAFSSVKPAPKQEENKPGKSLKEELIEKYNAPASMVTMLNCTIEAIVGSAMTPPEEPVVIFLVSELEDDQIQPNYYYIYSKVGQKILRCLAEQGKRFQINRERQDFRYRVNYYYVGPEMKTLLSERQERKDYETRFDRIIDVKLYKGRSICRNHGDIVQRVVAMLPGTRSDERHPLEVYFCPACKLYYVNEDAYLRFCDSYGLPPIKLYSYANDDFDGEGLRPISDLRAYGYDVSKDSQQNPSRRRRILVDLIESGLVTKAKVLSHLEFLNRLNRSKPEQINACRARQEDYDYISNYKINEDRVIWGRIVPAKTRPTRKW